MSSPIDKIRKFEDVLPELIHKARWPRVQYKHRCQTCGNEMTGFNAESVYNETLKLWAVSNVEQRAEGHPGIEGPSGDGIEWDRERAHLEAAMKVLAIIHERLYA